MHIVHSSPSCSGAAVPIGLGGRRIRAGMGPADYGHAQEGGDPVDKSKSAWTEVASS
jgi:hypothetical protein